MLLPSFDMVFRHPMARVDPDWFVDNVSTIYRHSQEKFEAIVSHTSIDINYRSKAAQTREWQGHTALMVVIESAHNHEVNPLDIARTFLQHAKIDLAIRNDDGHTALFLARRRRLSQLVDMISQHSRFDASLEPYYCPDPADIFTWST